MTLRNAASKTKDSFEKYLAMLPNSMEKIRLDENPDTTKPSSDASTIQLGTSEEMDPLIAAADYNYTHSALISLPEEIVIEIMECLIYDDAFLSIECLRRTCRLFLRLFDSSSFALFHNTRSLTDLGDVSQIKHFVSHHSALHEKMRPRLNSSHLPGLAARLHRNLTGYCHSCKLERSSSQFISKQRNLITNWIHCSARDKSHPNALFTPSDRKMRGKQRRCIGWRGRVRLCVHESISWEQVVEAAEYLSKRHNQVNGSRTGWAKAWPSGTIEISRCHDKSYMSVHHAHEKSTDVGVNGDDACPIATVEISERGTIDLFIRWKGHVRVKEELKNSAQDLGLDEKSPFSEKESAVEVADPSTTPEELAQHIRRMRHEGGVARYIAPEIAPGKLPEIRCFDPHRCHCLLYRGIEKLPVGARIFSSSSLGDKSQVICSSDASFRLDCLHQPRADESQKVGAARQQFKCDKGDDIPGSWNGTNEKRAVGGHSVDMMYAQGGVAECQVGGLSISVEPCEIDGDHCLIMLYQRSVGLFFFSEEQRPTYEPTSIRTNTLGTDADTGRWKGGMSVAWCQALDPDSYGLTSDSASQGISWCPQADCRNYHGYWGKAVAPVTSY